jgi:hypothetical protein
MKSFFLFTLLLCVVLSMTAAAQYPSNPPNQNDKASAASEKTIKGTVKAEGDKLTLVSDKDQKAWVVDNPEALKGHEGHHVQVKAQVDAATRTIKVTDVKMLEAVAK